MLNGFGRFFNEKKIVWVEKWLEWNWRRSCVIKIGSVDFCELDKKFSNNFLCKKTYQLCKRD